MKLKIILCIIILMLPASLSNAANIDDIKKEVIQKSIASYPGKCPCPYSTDSRGHMCGKRSAYSRAGGYEVNCYPKNVSDEDIRLYKLKNKGNY